MIRYHISRMYYEILQIELQFYILYLFFFSKNKY